MPAFIGARRSLMSSAASVRTLPTISASIAAAYATTLIVSGYAGPLFQLVRPSDGATLDVFPAANGLPDYHAVDAWASGQVPVVSIRHDQTGNGQHEQTTTTARRPSFSSFASVGGLRPVQFDTTINGSATVFPKDMAPPTTIALSRTNFGAFMVLNPRLSIYTVPYLEFSSGSTTQLVAFNGTTFSVSPSSQQTSKRLRSSRIQTLGVASDAASLRVFIEGVKSTLTAYSALAMGPTIKEGGSISAGYNGFQDSFCTILLGSAPTDADMATLNAWATSAFQIPTVIPTKRLVYGGSSLIYGQGSTFLRNPLQLMALDTSWDADNMAYPGHTLATEYANRVAYEFAQYDATKSKNVLVIDAPSNDIQAQTFSSQAQAQSWADTLYTNTTLPFVSSAKTAGFSGIGVPTIIARGSFTTANFGESARQEYNSQVVAGAAANGYVAADRASDARLGNTGNTAYFAADATHLTDVGYAILAAIDLAAINTASTP